MLFLSTTAEKQPMHQSVKQRVHLNDRQWCSMAGDVGCKGRCSRQELALCQPMLGVMFMFLSGVDDDKMGCLQALHAVEAYLTVASALPINIK